MTPNVSGVEQAQSGRAVVLLSLDNQNGVNRGHDEKMSFLHRTMSHLGVINSLL